MCDLCAGHEPNDGEWFKLPGPSDSTALLAGQFMFPLVFQVFSNLEFHETQTVFKMIDHALDLGLGIYGPSEPKPLTVRGKTADGKPWIWRKFQHYDGAEIVTQEDGDSDLPWIIDFSMPAHRPRMTAFEAHMLLSEEQPKRTR